MPRTAPVPNIPAIPGMNPGILVKAGGGAGGGAGAGGGRGKGGKKGAGGNSGEEEPGDGEKNGEDCGTGSPGGCTNCGSVISRGDPVNVATGEVFTSPVVDLALPGFFNLEIHRTYSSSNREQDCGYGKGWTHSLWWEIRIKGRSLTLRNGARQEATFPRLDAPGERAASGGWALMRTKSGFRVRPGNEFFHDFEVDPFEPERFRLARITYRERGSIELRYDRVGRLIEVIDTAGRTIQYVYGADSRIAQLRVPSISGGTITFASYGYDALGNLSSVVDADGFRTEYRYDERHRLTEQRLPTGLVFYFRYDSQDRCVETWGAYPGGVDPALVEDAPAVLADNVTPAKGIHHLVLEYGDDGESTAFDSVRMQRYFADGHKITKAVNGLGGVTTRHSDEEGRTREKLDPLSRRTTYEHDELGKVIVEQHEGTVTTVERDNEGRPTRVVDANGGVVEYHRNNAGELEFVSDQLGGNWRRILNARGLPTELVDPNGAVTRYQYDAHGNLVERVDADGRTHQFEYDYWGRRLRQVEADGSTGTWEYSNSGKMLAFVDALGRRKSVVYDALGKIIQVTTPDGLTTRLERGGFGWPTKVVFPDGTTQRCFYNREGWPMLLLNERGERQVVERNGEGMIVRQVTFDGRERHAGYDLRGNAAWFDEGYGRFEFERNALDQLTAVTAPDGVKRELQYNAKGELLVASQDGVTINWTRDAAGGIVEESTDIDGIRYSIKNRFDGLGRRVEYNSSLGMNVLARRDPCGRVTELTVNGAPATRTVYGPNGDPEAWSLSRGGRIDETWDRGRRLIARRVRAVDDSTDIVHKQLDYDSVNELVQRSDQQGSETFIYDARHHLLQRDGGGTSEKFRVDPTGNYSFVAADGSIPVYGEGNRLERMGNTRYDYDVTGNLIRRVADNGDGKPPAVTTYEWSAFGLLAAVESDTFRAEYQYDSFARRVAKRVSSKLPSGPTLVKHLHYVWDAQALLAEVDVTSGEPRVIRSYLYEENKRSLPIAQRDHSPDGQVGEWVYYVGDQNGTPEELVDGSGNVVGTIERTSFGKVVRQSGVATNFRFPGQYYDEESGLHYNRYRYFDPEIGRYISPDPRDIESGFNHYAYGPNPIGWFDPMGWMHSMTVESASGFDPSDLAAGDFFNSGFSGLKNDQGDCPAHLQSQARSHSERKFDEVVRQAHENGRITHPAQVTLKGELPPCRNCHRTMQKLADDTGVTVQYQYGSDSVTYSGSGDGSPGTTTFTDSALATGYAMNPIPENASGYTYQFANWGTAGTAYSTASGG